MTPTAQDPNDPPEETPSETSDSSDRFIHIWDDMILIAQQILDRARRGRDLLSGFDELRELYALSEDLKDHVDDLWVGLTNQDEDSE